MAGLIVGAGGPGGAKGVAPGARVLPIRVVGWQPTGTGRYAVFGWADQLLAGLERAVDPDQDGAVTDAAPIALVPVVEPFAAFGDSPEARAVAGAAALGTLVVAARRKRRAGRKPVRERSALRPVHVPRSPWARLTGVLASSGQRCG